MSHGSHSGLAPGRSGFSPLPSLRQASLNRRVLRVAAAVVRASGDGVDTAEFREFDLPPYTADLCGAGGLPPGLKGLIIAGGIERANRRPPGPLATSGSARRAW